MHNKMLYLYKPFIPEKVIEDIQNTLNKGLLTYGENGKKFESEFSKYIGIKNSCAVSSGTAALHIAMLALDIKQGDIVFVPDFTWSSTINVVELVGAKPVFIDVEIETHCMCLSHLEKKLNEYKKFSGKKVILPVHQHGYPMDMSKLQILSKIHNCLTIEDAACAIGSEHNKIKVGNFSDISCFSFHPRKILTTGEGGMVCSDNKSLADKIRRYANHGFQTDMKNYLFPGLNYRMTEIQSIIGTKSLSFLDEIILKRRDLKDIYFEYLKKNTSITLPAEINGHNWQTFLVLLDSSVNRDSFLKKLNIKGINAVKSSNSLCSLKYFSDKYGKNEEILNSKFISSQGIALPFCDSYGEKEVKLVSKAINSLL